MAACTIIAAKRIKVVGFPSLWPTKFEASLFPLRANRTNTYREYNNGVYCLNYYDVMSLSLYG